MIPSHIRAVLALAVCMGAASCASDPDAPKPKNPFRADEPVKTRRGEAALPADKLYRLARNALDVSDFTEAILRYDQLIQRYPFTEYATQAELERIFAYYRNYEDEQAVSAADRFLRDHPRHAAVDYAYYLRGLVNSRKEERLLDFLPGVDPSRGDVTYSRRAFDDFALLIRRYPQSRYAADARLRMIALRNRVAAHEMHVVDFYIRRGAWLAAVKRAEQVLAEYPGAPATLDALRALERCYTELELTQQAEDVRSLLASQPASSASGS